MTTALTEYPGLEAKAQEVFGIPFEALPSHLQLAVRRKVKHDAAEDMFTTLQAVVDAIPTNAGTCCVCQSDLSRHDEGCIIPIVHDAIKKASGQ